MRNKKNITEQRMNREVRNDKPETEMKGQEEKLTVGNRKQETENRK